MKARFWQVLTLLFAATAFFLGGLYFSEFATPYSQRIQDNLSLKELICPSETTSSAIIPTPKTTSTQARPTPTPKPADFTGPQLFDAINQKRVQYGVNQLSRNDDLCSLASYRLNQLLPSGTIDNHAGFIALSKDPNSPFARVFEQYNIAEFLVYLPSGTAQDAVNAWNDTLGHQKILRGGEFTIGCAYAQRGIGVALAGY